MPKLKRQQKQAWMVAAEIPQNTLFMMSEATRFFINEWPRRGLGGFVTQYASYFVKDFTRMLYQRQEFDAQAEYLAGKMIKNPRWAIGLIGKVERWSALFFQQAKKIYRAPLRSLTNRQIIRLYKQSLQYHRLSHGVGGSISWHADAEKERVTKAIWQALEGHLKKIGSRYVLAEIFSTLTTPTQESIVWKEELDFLRIAVAISDRPKVKRLFIKQPEKLTLDIIRRMDRSVARLIARHHRDFSWLTYQYKGPATSLEDYLSRWRQLFMSKEHPRAMLRKMITSRQQLIRQQRTLIRSLRLTTYLRDLVTLAQRLVFIKDYRKDALYHGMYCYEPMFVEIGRRCGLTIDQIRTLGTWDIPDLLQGKTFDVNELNRRQELAVAYVTKRSYAILTGERAQHFIKHIRFEKPQVKKTNELRGTPACPGLVIGRVKVINVPEEMKKMRKGDIMVAHNTNPNLVPAMKLAAALVSEAGGLTCHTAIVARELRTPCVVGVSGADKILKDGDKVEVDATNGVIRKVK